MENAKIFIKDSCTIPCTVCKRECLNKGWHLANGNFCSIECMCRFIEKINLILDDFEQKINELENKIIAQEKFIKKTEGDKSRLHSRK